MNDFNDIAKDYVNLIDDTLAIKGDNLHKYFAEYKALNIKWEIQNALKADGLKILDYGCGIGILSYELSKILCKNTIIHGFDISDESIRNVPESLKTGRNSFTSNIEALDDDYDIVILSNVIHHVPIEDRIDLLRSIHNRLLGGGLLVIIEHNMFNPLTKKSVYDCPFDADAHMVTKREMGVLLQTSGYSLTVSRYITFFPPKLAALRAMDKYLGWMPLGAQYMACAKRVMECGRKSVGASRLLSMG